MGEKNIRIERIKKWQERKKSNSVKETRGKTKVRE